MITTRSALLERKTRTRILSHPARAWVVSRLSYIGMSEQEIGEALNCSLSVVGQYLTYATPRFSRINTSAEPKKAQEANTQRVPRSATVLLRYRPPQTRRGITGELERRAHHLAVEIHGWLAHFNINDTQRQQIIESAWFLLDASPLTLNGDCLLDKHRTYSELLGIWHPRRNARADESLETKLSRWLASWIRFWIVQPAVWNRALDLEFAQFSSHPKAA